MYITSYNSPVMYASHTEFTYQLELEVYEFFSIFPEVTPLVQDKRTFYCIVHHPLPGIRADLASPRLLWRQRKLLILVPDNVGNDFKKPAFAYLSLVYEAVFARQSACFVAIAIDLHRPSIRVFQSN